MSMENEMLSQETREQSVEFLRQESEKFGVEMVAERVDLTSLSNEEVLNFFDDVARSNRFVLHGTNTNEPYAELEPRQSNDTVKESGNKKAVYATVEKFAALNHAIFNQAYVGEKLRSYAWSENNIVNDDSGAIEQVQVKMSPELYQLFKEHDPNVMSDGFVYVLDKSSFVSAPDAGDIEFHSEEPQTPLVICKISKKLGDVLFFVGGGEDKDTVHEYTPEELEQIAAHKEKVLNQK